MDTYLHNVVQYGKFFKHYIFLKLNVLYIFSSSIKLYLHMLFIAYVCAAKKC